jgi:hypothetical protein
MLHSFFYPEAGRTFTKVTAIDQGCALGYWGVAMSWWYPLWYLPTKESLAQDVAAVEKANGMGVRASATTSQPSERRQHEHPPAAVASFAGAVTLT